jgi:DNA-binding NarL/FixJ family response regulator
LEASLRPLDVLIVDDEQYFCHVARQVLSRSPRFAVVGETYGALEAMEMIDQLRPDLVLMDVEMGDISGLQATYTIKSRYPEIRIVLMSIYDEREYSRLARIAGALAFIPKKDFTAPALLSVLDRVPSNPLHA